MFRSLADWLGWERVSDANRKHEELRKDHENIMAKLSTLPEQLAEIKRSQDEANREIREKLDAQTKRITELEELLGDVEIPEAAQTLINELKAGSKELADIVPNAPTEG